jgi:hypothetical protein
LEGRFEVALGITSEKPNIVFLDKKSATELTKKAVLESREEVKKFIDEILDEINRMISYIKNPRIEISMNPKNVKIFNNDELFITFLSKNKLEVNATMSEKNMEELKGMGFEVSYRVKGDSNTVIVLPPLAHEKQKPLQKSINVEAEDVEKQRISIIDSVLRGTDSAPSDKKFTVIDGTFKSTDETNARVAIIKEKNKEKGEPIKVVVDKKEVEKVIHNPEQNITLDDTQQIMSKIDMGLVNKYINVGSINKNVPSNLKAKVLMRLEGAIKKVLASNDGKRWFNPREKYGVLKSAFFDENKYTLFNGNLYMKFLDAENLVFENKLA